jgi:ABC-type branched-subunit amino acid transport system permease subunit
MIRQWHIALISLVAIGACAALPLVAGPYALGIALNILMWIALAESWAMFSGLSGYISLGHAAFYGAGAYVTVLLWMVVPLWLAIPVSGLAAALLAAGLGWPCLRVRGPFRDPHARCLRVHQIHRDQHRGWARPQRPPADRNSEPRYSV